MAEQITLPQLFDNDSGAPVIGTDTIEFFDTGTSTPREIFSDVSLTTSLGYTLDTNAGGRASTNPVYVSSATDVKVVLKDAEGVALETLDPVGTTTTSTSAATDISFDAVTGNAATNVQAAIANNTAALSSEDTARYITSNKTESGGVSKYRVNRGSGTSLTPVIGERIRLQVNEAPTTNFPVQIALYDGTTEGDYYEVRLISGGGSKTAIGPVTTNGMRWEASSMPDMVFDGTYWVIEQNIPVGTGGNRLVQFDASGKYPAADGSQITGLDVQFTGLSYTNGGLITQAHGLSSAPDPVSVTAVCVTAEGVFNIGDKVQVPSMWNSSSNYYGAVAWSDATNIYVRIGREGLRVFDGTGVQDAVWTPANWTISLQGKI